MLKPASLRAALECALPELAANPDRLILYIDEGRIHSRYGDSLSFEYRYRLNLVLLDYAHHASAAQGRSPAMPWPLLVRCRVVSCSRKGTPSALSFTSHSNIR